MARWMLFFHIIGFAFWLGAMAAVYVVYRKHNSSAAEGGLALTTGTIRTLVLGVLNPSALLVLFTGVGMMSAMGLTGQPKPFWLMFMEMFGGTVSLLSVALLTWQLRRVVRAQSDHIGAQRLAGLMRIMVPVGGAVIATIGVVALRIG